jgi:hypothetical protein
MADELQSFAIRLQDEGENAVGVVWDVAALAALAPPDAEAAPQVPWQLADGHPDWERWESLRVLSAAFEEGSMLAFAALRPRNAGGHDEDVLRAVLVRDGAESSFEDVLVSMQFDAAGALGRLNVEAYAGADAVPLRASGNVVSRRSGQLDTGSLEVNVLEMRMDGHRGPATVDILRPA